MPWLRLLLDRGQAPLGFAREHDNGVVKCVPGRLYIWRGRRLARVVAALAGEVAGDTENDVTLQILVVVHKDLGNHRLVSGLVTEHVQVRGAVRVATLVA